jgi:hypothetical protein
VVARVKQLGEGASFCINACDVRALVKVAVDASQGQIVEFISPVMLAGTNVFDLQGEERGMLLRQPAILATASRALSHGPLDCRIH